MYPTHTTIHKNKTIIQNTVLFCQSGKNGNSPKTLWWFICLFVHKTMKWQGTHKHPRAQKIPQQFICRDHQIEFPTRAMLIHWLVCAKFTEPWKRNPHRVGGTRGVIRESSCSCFSLGLFSSFSVFFCGLQVRITVVQTAFTGGHHDTCEYTFFMWFECVSAFLTEW